MATIPGTITATTTVEELFDILISMSSNVSPESVVSAIEALPESVHTEKIGLLAVQASMSVKKVVDKVALAAAVTLPEAWQVNGSVNFSMLALLGHMMFLLPDEALTPSGKVARKAYSKSIGGSENLSEFGATGTIVSKPKRSEILREWSIRLESSDLERARRAMSQKFPYLVLPARPSAPATAASLALLPAKVVLMALAALRSVLLRVYAFLGLSGFVAIALYFPGSRNIAIPAAVRVSSAVSASAARVYTYAAPSSFKVAVSEAAEEAGKLHVVSLETFPLLEELEAMAKEIYEEIMNADFEKIASSLAGVAKGAWIFLTEVETDPESEAGAGLESDKEREEASEGVEEAGVLGKEEFWEVLESEAGMEEE